MSPGPCRDLLPNNSCTPLQSYIITTPKKHQSLNVSELHVMEQNVSMSYKLSPALEPQLLLTCSSPADCVSTATMASDCTTNPSTSTIPKTPHCPVLTKSASNHGCDSKQHVCLLALHSIGEAFTSN